MRYALCFLVLSGAVCFSAEENSAAKPPVPEKAAVAEAEKKIRDMFKADYAKATPSDRAALGDKLLSQGIEEQKDLPSKYVLLRDARDIAAATGDATKAVKAVSEMAKAFAIDAFAEKTAALAKAEVAARTADAAEPLARQYAELADEALAADKHEIALKALSKASTAATTAKNVPLVNQLREKAQKTQAMQREYTAASSALKTVAEKPDDPAANLAVGKYICFFKEAWDAGLPYLAKGSDSALKAIAEKDVAKATGAEEQAALADAWQATAEKQQGTIKSGCMARACYWYEQAGPKLTGLQRTKVINAVDAYDKAIGRVRMNPVLTPEEHVKALVERLKAVNPGWDGKFEHKIEGGRLVELSFIDAKIRDISPLKGITLETLKLIRTQCFDLRPLAGAHIADLNLGGSMVRDISPLRGMPLRKLCLHALNIADVSPLKDSPLEHLLLDWTAVADLTPLAKLPLKHLGICGCRSITDISGLRGMSLENITLSPKTITKGWDALRNMKTLAAVEVEAGGTLYPVDEFWKKFDAGEFKGVADKPDKKTK